MSRYSYSDAAESRMAVALGNEIAASLPGTFKTFGDAWDIALKILKDADFVLLTRREYDELEAGAEECQLEHVDDYGAHDFCHGENDEKECVEIAQRKGWVSPEQLSQAVISATLRGNQAEEYARGNDQ